MARKLKNEPAVVLLSEIEQFLESYNPPVETFERSIRSTSFRILVSVLLSSRTKDEVTELASKKLFDLIDTPESMIELGEKKISELIYPVGFYRQKSKNLVRLCQELVKRGSIPDDFDQLVSLPGVGRKTANLVLSLAFRKPAIAVDIHVFRISKRLAWAQGRTPEIVESELKALFPPKYWSKINRVLVGFGQTICRPRNPRCHECRVSDACRYFLATKI